MENKGLDAGDLRETRLIVPVFDRAGERATDALKAVQTYLTKNFGGYTMTQGVGAWASPGSDLPTTEPVLIFDVAAAPTLLTRMAMVVIAHEVCARMHQEAVYLRHGDGRVVFITVGVSNTQDEDG